MYRISCSLRSNRFHILGRRVRFGSYCFVHVLELVALSAPVFIDIIDRFITFTGVYKRLNCTR
jgi:hypothetical protein